jgi:hypothetical protein
LQLAQIAVNCNAAEKALLADVTEAHPDASYIDLLRLFKVRRRSPMGTRIAHVELCLLRVACAKLLAAAALYPLFGSTLFVCLCVCLFVCLLATGPCKTHHRWRGLHCTRVVAR